MAVISPNTFDPLKRYIAVRLQQGVPIIDADWNELEDTRRFELRAFLKWFVGDGIPEGTDGFRVVGTGATNDFTLSAGLPSGLPTVPPLEKGLRQVGRCLVDGMDVILPADLAFRAQPLHVSQPGSAALATAWGVPQVQELPALNGTLLVYLDVWERLVTPSEDAGLVFPGLGTESCARLRREWVVRFRQSETVPALKTPPDPDFLPGHSYYALARVTRRASGGPVQPADVVDLRERRLLVPPATLVEDTLGTSPTRYRQGLDRPPVNLRTAINALLRGELPMTPERTVATLPGQDDLRRNAFFDNDRKRLLAFWNAGGPGGEQVVGSRLDLNAIDAGFGPPVNYTTGPQPNTPAAAALLPDGGVLLAYQKVTNAPFVVMKRLAPDLGAGAVEISLGAPATAPFIVVSGDIAVCFFYATGTSQWQFRRFRHTDNTFLDANPVLLSNTTTSSREFHAAAARDAAGMVWALFRVGGVVQLVQVVPSTGVIKGVTTFEASSGGTVPADPFVLGTPGGDVWVLWNAFNGLGLARYNGPTMNFLEARTIPFTEGASNAAAAMDAEGALWIFFNRADALEIWSLRRGPDGSYGQSRLLTGPHLGSKAPFPLLGPNGALWLLYTGTRQGEPNLMFRQVFTSL